MTSFRTVAVLALAGFTLAIVPAHAASLGCTVLPEIGVSGPFGGGPIPRYAIIRNTLSSAVPAGAVYSYQIAGKTWTHQAPQSLPPGATLTVKAQTGAPAGACIASVPTPPRFKIPVGDLPTMTLSRP